MFLNSRLKSFEILSFEALARRTELTSKEKIDYSAAARGYDGECLYDKIFNDAGHDDILIYRDLYLKIGETVTQYDALIINDDGVVINEIKNYTGEYRFEGGNWYKGDYQIPDDPLAQLKRAAGKLIRLRNEARGNFNVSGKLIFPSDEFYLKTDEPSVWGKVVTRIDLRKYLRNFSSMSAGNKANYIARLISTKIVENPYFRVNIEERRIRKGLHCEQCGSYNLTKSRFHLTCGHCDSKLANETYLLRALSDYKYIYFGKPMTRNAFLNFIGYRLSSKVVYRILLKHCTVEKRGNKTTYSFKYYDFEEAMGKPNLFRKYINHIKD